MHSSTFTRRLAAMAVTVVSVPTMMIATDGPASAAAQCVFTPKPPARISVGQTVVGMTTPLAASNPACKSDFDASTQLVHGTDSYYLMWYNANPDVESVYASEIVPGIYRTTANYCDAMNDATYATYSCAIANASTVIKFASRTTWTVSRRSATVTFVVHSKRYFDYTGFAGVIAPIAIQRYGNGAWHTIHTARTTRSTGAAWSYRHAARAKYRAVTAETGLAFASYSATVTR